MPSDMHENEVPAGETPPTKVALVNDTMMY